MRMENFTTEFTVRKFWAYVKPDAFNNTAIRLDGRLAWPVELEDWEDPPALPKPGTMFRLEIPSGTLSGIITDVVDVNDILQTWVIESCVWDGKYAGLANGDCGNGSFRSYAGPNTIVYSSISDGPLSYGEYIAIRRVVEAATRQVVDGPAIWLGPEANRELMRSALRYLKALREEAQRLLFVT